MTRDQTTRGMKERWDERALRDPFFYVETAFWKGDIESFFRVGEERAALLVDPVLPSLSREPAAATALDLGCGVGRFTRALGERFKHVLGVDVSPEMIRRAEELHPAGEFPNLRFLTGDGLSLDVPSRSIDFVFSYEVFQHLPSRDVMRRNLSEIARVLRPDGIALVHVHIAPSRRARLIARAKYAVPDRLWSRLKRMSRSGDVLTSDSSFRGSPPLTPSEVERLWRECGLHTTSLRADPTHPPRTRVFVEARRLAEAATAGRSAA